MRLGVPDKTVSTSDRTITHKLNINHCHIKAASNLFLIIIFENFRF